MCDRFMTHLAVKRALSLCGCVLSKHPESFIEATALFPAGRVSHPLVCIPVVIWLKGPVLVQAQILGLLVRKLCEMCVKRWEMEAGHILVWGGQGRGAH